MNESILRGAALVGQSGGPTAVINASAWGVVKTAMAGEHVTRVLGAVHGIKGVLDDQLFDFGNEDPKELPLLSCTPSSALGSCRYKMKDPAKDPTDYERIYEIFKKYDIRYFFYIGGNDSMDTCQKVSDYLASVGYPCRVMGVPKTIDNDLFGTDHCPGYGSAAKYIATTMMELYLDATVYDTGMVTIVEIMGRNAGWLTAAAALAEPYGPDLIYLPEKPFDLDRFFQDVERVYNEKKKVIVAVSEGIRDKDGRYISEYGSDLAATKDAFGHAQMGGLALTLADMVKARLGAKVRGIELSLLQRCAAHTASGADITEAFAVGEAAVASALEGKSGFMVAIRRGGGASYKAEYALVPLKDVANFEHKVPLEWIGDNGSGMARAFFDYARPLIQGETCMVKENGLPKFARLKREIITK